MNFLKERLRFARWEAIDMTKIFLNQFFGSNLIIGRFACLGNDVLLKLNLRQFAINIQKGRIDYLLNYQETTKIKTNTIQVINYLERKDIKYCIWQQEKLNILQVSKPKAIFFDSFSELTDQLFKHKKQGWEFCSNYTDINHQGSFEEEFQSLGLISLELLKTYYLDFFSYIRKRYGNVPIFFLHFPSILDKREKFKFRQKVILEIINNISANFEPFYSISVNDDIVDFDFSEQGNEVKFPYHYNTETYNAFVEKIKQTGILEEIFK